MSTKTKKKKPVSQRTQGKQKLPPNARRFPVARPTYQRIAQALGEMHQAAQIHAQKAQEAAGQAQTVADERGLGPIGLHSVVEQNGKTYMWYVPKKGRAVAPDHVRRGRR